jgi:hypothetical protein
MLNAVLIFLALLLCLAMLVFLPPMVAPFAAEIGHVSSGDVSKAILLCLFLSVIAGFYARKQGKDGPFLLKLFVGALLTRMLVGAIIFAFNAQDFFGGDAITYDFFGYAQLKAWGGDRYFQTLAGSFVGQGESAGWGMVYLVAAVYGLLGRNMLAIQFISCVFGAVTPVVVFLCSQHVFSNSRVARISALAAAFYPSLVLWSSQGLKDGLVIFILTFSILATLKLGEKFRPKYVFMLILCLFGLLTFRFYVFYMLAAAIGGAFVIGLREVTGVSVFRQFAILAVLGLSLTYLGVTRYANLSYQRFGSLQTVQRSRVDAATAQSGFARDVDVSTAEGALATIPVGLLYLLFAPFPWQVVSLRQSLTLPEMIVWWVSFPMLILGLWYSIKYRLRMISPILTFTMMLSLAYSIFQGNVGTAYRQRAQLLVFYFIFTAVGYVIIFEKREAKKLIGQTSEQPAMTPTAGQRELTIPPATPTSEIL